MDKLVESPPEFSLEFAAKPEYLVLIRSFISCFAQQLNLDKESALQLEICLDEACANSVEAVQKKEGKDPISTIRLEINLKVNGVEVTIVDHAHDFSRNFQQALPLDDFSDRTQKRGYGLQIIKSLMDEVNYDYDPEVGNRLSLTKYFR